MRNSSFSLKVILTVVIPFALVLLSSSFSSTTYNNNKEEEKIKAVCLKFIQGRKELKNGNTSILKKVTFSNLYEVILLNRAYEKLVDGKVYERKLDLYPQNVQINDSCATCQMKGSTWYELILCKENRQWKVKGENNHIPTKDQINRMKKKIEKYKVYLTNKPEIVAALGVVHIFLDDINKYFKNPNENDWHKTCSASTINTIKEIRDYAFKRTGKALLLEEMSKPNVRSFSITIDDELAFSQPFSEDVWLTLKKIDGKYIIVGFNKMYSDDISGEYINHHYIKLLRALYLVRPEEYRNKVIQ